MVNCRFQSVAALVNPDYACFICGEPMSAKFSQVSVPRVNVHFPSCFRSGMISQWLRRSIMSYSISGGSERLPSNVSLRGVSDEAISWHGPEIASQSLAMTRSGKWGCYSGYDPICLTHWAYRTGRHFESCASELLITGIIREPK